MYALTPKEEKGVITLKSDRLAWEAPDWLTPFSLLDAPQDITYWKSIIPYPWADQYDMYIVLPTLWVVAPIIRIPQWSQDFEDMRLWREIDINKYLNDWVLHYAGTPMPWEEWNPVIFWHSNFFRNAPWDYKTIFADIMALDPIFEDEIWIFDGTDNWWSFELIRFAIEQSYETVPTDVEILLPQWWREITVFACTNWLEWRWILRWRKIEMNEVLIPFSMRFRFLSTLDDLKKLPPTKQDEIVRAMNQKITTIRSEMDLSDSSYDAKFKRYVLNYIERTLNQ